MKKKLLFFVANAVGMLLLVGLLSVCVLIIICQAASMPEVEAIFYINNTGLGSKYISYTECEEVTKGTIVLDSSDEVLVVRDNPDSVLTHLVDIPDCSEYLQENTEIVWKTIYRSDLVYRVIGEVIVSEQAISNSSNEELSSDDEDISTEDEQDFVTGEDSDDDQDLSETIDFENELELELVDEDIFKEGLTSAIEEEKVGSKFTENENDINATATSKVVEAYYYINMTGKSSKYISYSECKEARKGTIRLNSSSEVLADRDDPTGVATRLVSIPNYSDYLSSNEKIVWMTIYRSNLVYRVIGEIKQTTGSLVYDTVADMLKASLKPGTKVSTKGYYIADDGGAGEYIISDKPAALSEQLRNGYYANLNFSDSVNVRQVGASGDGVTDDSDYFNKLISNGITNIIVPEGNYNFYGKYLQFPSHGSIKGTDYISCILKNVTIIAQYGLDMSNVTCDKGAKKKVIVDGCTYEAYVTVVTSPIGTQAVSYSKCAFTNTDFALFANDYAGDFSSDVVSNCIFKSIGHIAIFHGVNSKSSKYNNNHFRVIGSTGLKEGIVSAIWVGDVAGVSNTKSDVIGIIGNTFEYLWTATDLSGATHVLNANFIAVMANKATISDNNISYLEGYGRDREAIYVKANNVIIENNSITNGGSGEAYICCKGASDNPVCTISGNTIKGDFGTGIRVYGGANITGNSIDIKHCRCAILSSNRNDQTQNLSVTVSENVIVSSVGDVYKYKGNVIRDYDEGAEIKIIGAKGAVLVSGNTIKPTNSRTSFISISDCLGTITVDGNDIKAQTLEGKGIAIYTSSGLKANTSQTITIKNNTIALKEGQNAVVANFTDGKSIRKIYYDSNTVNFSSAQKNSYPLKCYSVSNNSDTLELSGNSSNQNMKNLTIIYSTQKLINSDKNFATLSKMP